MATCTWTSTTRECGRDQAAKARLPRSTPRDGARSTSRDNHNQRRPYVKKPLTLALAVLAWAALDALAQGSYPEKTITVIVPQAAGGANDTIARIVTQR